MNVKEDVPLLTGFQDILFWWRWKPKHLKKRKKCNWAPWVRNVLKIVPLGHGEGSWACFPCSFWKTEAVWSMMSVAQCSSLTHKNEAFFHIMRKSMIYMIALISSLALILHTSEFGSLKLSSTPIAFKSNVIF